MRAFLRLCVSSQISVNNAFVITIYKIDNKKIVVNDKAKIKQKNVNIFTFLIFDEKRIGSQINIGFI